MACARGCCATPAEHYRSIAMRARVPGPKRTVDHTDTAVVTTTEHFTVDRQDVHVAMSGPRVELNPNAIYESKAAGVRFRPEGGSDA